MSKYQLRKVIVIPDLQVPYHDTKSISAVQKYIVTHAWDECVFLGDFMDFSQVSKWNKELPGNWETTVYDDYLVGNELLDEFESNLRRNNKKVKITFILGNHDVRPELLVRRQPQLKGQIEIEGKHGLRLHQRGYKVVRAYPEGERVIIHRIGNAAFTHGIATGKFHTNKMAQDFGMCIYYGHTHDVQLYTQVTFGEDKIVEAHSLGCLCNYQQSYLSGPTRWQQAFGVFYFFPSGFYNMYCVRVFEHRFVSPEGVVYEG